MIQPQLINLVPNMQAGATTSARSNGSRAAQSGMFEDMLNQGGTKLNRQPAASKARKTALGEAEKPQTPRPKQQPEDENSNLYSLNPAAPPVEPPLAGAPDNSSAEAALQILDTIVSILEGNQSNTSTDKDIVTLLAELEQNLPQPAPDELTKMLEEIMARTPQTEDITETPQKLAKLNQFIETLRGYLCPPENVNEDQNLAAAVKAAEFVPAPSGTPMGGTATDTEEETFSQAKAEDNGAAIPEGASFDIAPARLVFAERLSAAATPASQPLTAENLFDAMVERIVSLPDAEPHMEIALKPDHLGKLSIDLQLTENGLTAKILASDEGVRNMLAAHVNRLSETLAERGIRVESVEVIYTALSDKAFDQRQPGQEARQSAPRENAIPGLVEPLVPQPWENAYDLPLYADNLDWGLSSVEYRA